MTKVFVLASSMLEEVREGDDPLYEALHSAIGVFDSVEKAKAMAHENLRDYFEQFLCVEEVEKTIAELRGYEWCEHDDWSNGQKAWSWAPEDEDAPSYIIRTFDLQ